MSTAEQVGNGLFLGFSGTSDVRVEECCGEAIINGLKQDRNAFHQLVSGRFKYGVGSISPCTCSLWFIVRQTLRYSGTNQATVSSRRPVAQRCWARTRLLCGSPVSELLRAPRAGRNCGRARACWPRPRSIGCSIYYLWLRCSCTPGVRIFDLGPSERLFSESGCGHGIQRCGFVRAQMSLCGNALRYTGITQPTLCKTPSRSVARASTTSRTFRFPFPIIS